MPSERLEDTIRSVRTTTSTATDERIMAAIEAAMSKQNEQRPASVHTSGLIRRIIMKNRRTKFAAAPLRHFISGLIEVPKLLQMDNMMKRM